MIQKLICKQNIAVLGLKKSGISTIKFLKQKGLNPIGWDDDKEVRFKVKQRGINVKDLKKINLSNFSLLIVSPGIPSYGDKKHSIVKKAESKGIEVINDIELFFRLNKNSKCIGITGTNGKSTTVSLINHVLNQIKIKNSVGGNIGRPIFDIQVPKGGFYVLEISSFQLELMKSSRFKVGIILNITNDHLDRHGSFKKYASEKIKIFNNQQKEDIAIVGVDNNESLDLLKKTKKKLKSQIITISGQNKKSNIYVKNNYLVIDCEYKNKKIFKEINLKNFKNIIGPHNYQNLAAVYAVLIKLGFHQWKKIENSIKTFNGLPHRLQKIREINKIQYINDSKATNLDSTDKALSSYNNIYWILGGKAKEKNLNKLKKHFIKINHVFLLGETKTIYEKYIKKYLNYTITKDLKEAVISAHNLAQQKIISNTKSFPVILFSPACSSLDEWENFEERGNAFIKLVTKLNS